MCNVRIHQAENDDEGTEQDRNRERGARNLPANLPTFFRKVY